MNVPLSEMPQFPAAIGVKSDHAYLERCRAIGPLLRDRFNTVTSFSLEHLTFFMDDRWTRQLELEGMHASGVRSGASYDLYKNLLLFSNGADHRNRRGPLARTFAVPLIAAMRPAVAERVERMIAPLVGRGPVAFIENIAGPLPACTVASFIGAPEEDGPFFAKLAYVAARGFALCTPKQRAEADDAIQTISDYIQDLIDDRRAKPQQDFLTSYLEKVDAGPLSAEEIRAQIVGLIVAGSDTTRGSLTSTVSQLMQHRAQWQMLIDDPETHAPGAVSEGLRYDPIIGALARIATQDIELEGYLIPKETLITPSIMAVLHDPVVYKDPGVFDITRTDHPRQHPVFGMGPHRCIGEQLARIQLEEALKCLARLAPDMTIDGPPTKLKGFNPTRSASEMRVVL